MKKGLLSILALAVTIVGCQNYDDQFDALNTQITALKSQVEGLGAVQSQITSLSGTLASLQSTVNSLPSSSDVSAAISSELADIIADVEALQTQLDGVATAADLETVSGAVSDAQDSLNDLLTSSNIYSEDVIVDSQGKLDFALALGDKLSIVNGNVTFVVGSTMNLTDVQTVLDNIGTVVGNFSYLAGSTVSAVTFDNITGTDDIEVSQYGDYSFQGLVSAANIYLGTAGSSKVGVVHFGALTTVTSINTTSVTEHSSGGSATADVRVSHGSTGTNSVNFDKATEVHLTSLPYYTNNTLSITTDEGGVVAIPALKSEDADGDVVALTLTLNGPASVNISTIADGTISVTNVATFEIDNFYGSLDVNAGVENLTANSVQAIDLAGATDLEVASIEGALDYDPELTTADTTGPAIDLSTATSLEQATISGVTGNITASGNTKLTSLTVTADTNGGTLNVTNNDDLTSLTVTGAKIGNITIHDNDDLVTATLDHTADFAATTAGATVAITDNDNLETLTYTQDKVDSLTVTGNTDLETIDFTGLVNSVIATGVSVDVSGNKLTASLAKNAYDATATTDTGAYTTASGMETLATYLGNVKAKVGSTGSIGVSFDEIDLSQVQSTATGTYADTSADYTTVLSVSAGTAASGSTVRETVSYAFDLDRNALNAIEDLASGEGISYGFGGVTATHVQGTSPAISTVADLIAAINADTSLGSDISVTASQGDVYTSAKYTVKLLDSDSGAASATYGAGVLYWSFGTKTGLTGSISAGATGTGIAAAIATAINSQATGGADYTATASNGVITITESMTGTAGRNIGTGVTIPALAIDIDNASSTADFQLGSATNSTSAPSFTWSFTRTDQSGLLVKFVNNSTTINLATNSFVAPTIASGATLSAGPTELVSGTNQTMALGIDAAFSDIDDPTAAVAGSTTSRLLWLSTGS